MGRLNWRSALNQFLLLVLGLVGTSFLAAVLTEAGPQAVDATQIVALILALIVALLLGIEMTPRWFAVLMVPVDVISSHATSWIYIFHDWLRARVRARVLGLALVLAISLFLFLPPE